MSEITNKIRYTELPDAKYQALFKFADGSTILGMINYENGDVYIGEIDPDGAFDEKRDRRRHGYGKLLSKGATTESQWHEGLVVGDTIKTTKTGKRSFECRGQDPKRRTILYQYYITEDNQYGGDRYNGSSEYFFHEYDVIKVSGRTALRDNLFNGTPIPEASAPKTATAPKPAPVKKTAQKEEKKSAPKAEKKTASKKAEKKSDPKPEEKPAPQKTAPKAEEKPAPKIPLWEELRQQAMDAEANGDTETAIKQYFEAAKYADIEALRAYLRLAVPGIYATVDKARAEFTAEKLYAVEKKLSKIERNIFGRSTGKRYDGTGMKLIQEARCDDSPYADRLKASCCRDNDPQRLQYLQNAADRGDYLAIFDLLKYYEKDSTKSYDGRYVFADGVFDPDKLWHNLLVLVGIAERRILWFTSKKLQDVYGDFHKIWGEHSFTRIALNKVAETISGLVEREKAPGQFDTSVPVPEELKPQIFRWLSFLVENYQPYKVHDYGRYCLAYMLDAGCGCEKDPKKAQTLVCDGISTDSAGIQYAKDSLPDYISMSGPVAYIIANHSVEQGIFDTETKDLLSFAAEKGKVEDYRKLARMRLDLFVEDPSERFQTAFNYYQAGEYEQAAVLWRSLADQGNATACKNVAVLYGDHLKTEDAPQLKRYYMKKGADLGDLQACRSYGSLLREEGQYEEAYRYYEKATGIVDDQDRFNGRGNSYLAMAELLYDEQVKKVYGKEHAIFYAHKAKVLGVEVTRKFSEAGAKWMMAYKALTVTEEFKEFALEKGVEEGNPHAHLEMGIKYLRGDGVEQDLDVAAAHLKKAPAGTRRDYHLMCVGILNAEMSYTEDTTEQHQAIVESLDVCYYAYWLKIKDRDDYVDSENEDDLMQALHFFWQMDENKSFASNMACLMVAADKAADYYYSTHFDLAYYIFREFSARKLQMYEDHDISEDQYAEELRSYYALIKDAVENDVLGAEEDAQKLFNHDHIGYYLEKCRCSATDTEGVSLQRFIASYAPDSEEGWVAKARFYLGDYLGDYLEEKDEKIDETSARRYLMKLAECDSKYYSGYGYRRLALLDDDSEYLIRAARLGDDIAQKLCNAFEYDW